MRRSTQLTKYIDSIRDQSGHLMRCRAAGPAGHCHGRLTGRIHCIYRKGRSCQKARIRCIMLLHSNRCRLLFQRIGNRYDTVLIPAHCYRRRIRFRRTASHGIGNLHTAISIAGLHCLRHRIHARRQILLRIAVNTTTKCECIQCHAVHQHSGRIRDRKGNILYYPGQIRRLHTQ